MEALQHLPEYNSKWLLYGVGFENLGKNDRYEKALLREIKPNEVLLKVEAVSLCFSDIKVIKQGNEHPRLIGRDLSSDPVVLAHEVAASVVYAGSMRQSMFSPGEKYIIQPDIFYDGKAVTMGYVLDGALQQYIIAGDEILDGDEGCYLFPMRSGIGYSEAALCEPWSCVEASYHIPYRTVLKNQGIALIIGNEGIYGEPYTMGELITQTHCPKRIIVSNVNRNFFNEIKDISNKYKIDLIEEDNVKNWPDINVKYTDSAGFDDIIMLGAPEPRMVEEAADMLARFGVFAIVASEPIAQKANIDVGRLHYDGILFTGTNTKSIETAYSCQTSIDIPSGGAMWLAGGCGPMGQMHVQRTCERDNGPEFILVTDIDDTRLQEVKNKFSNLAEARGASLVCATANEAPLTDEKFDYIVILAPVIELIAQAFDKLAPNGIVNLFAGVPIGTKIPVDVSNCYLHGQRWIGSSGTSNAHMRSILEKIESKSLETNRSVAAVGGLDAAKDGLIAVAQGAKPGKVIIYPQIHFPLTSIMDLKQNAPVVFEKLEDGAFWSIEAEMALLAVSEYGDD